MFYATPFINFLNVASASSDERMLSTYLRLQFCCQILALTPLSYDIGALLMAVVMPRCYECRIN